MATAITFRVETGPIVSMCTDGQGQCPTEVEGVPGAGPGQPTLPAGMAPCSPRPCPPAGTHACAGSLWDTGDAHGGTARCCAEAGSGQERWAALSAPTERWGGSATRLKPSTRRTTRQLCSAPRHRTYRRQGGLSNQSLVRQKIPSETLPSGSVPGAGEAAAPSSQLPETAARSSGLALTRRRTRSSVFSYVGQAASASVLTPGSGHPELVAQGPSHS